MSGLTLPEKCAAAEAAFAHALTVTPAVTGIPSFTPDMPEFAHIRAVTYDGLDRHGLKTKVFAYIGFPAGASPDKPVPGVVLIHGGGGHPFLQWVKMWNDRGYAAIAPDDTGFFPTAINAGDTELTQAYAYGLSGVFCEEGYTASPACDCMLSAEGPLDDMWMYHAVGQTILANNVLRADPRVDADAIGMTGISWGGVIAALVIGYDPRFAFAVPVYGSGYMTEARSHMKPRFAGEAVQALWSAKHRFDRAVTPTLWLCWNDDNCFSLNSNSQSFADTAKVNPLTRLAAKNRMMHSHSCGWTPAEPMVYADSVVKGTPRLPGFRTQPAGRSPECLLEVDAGVTITGVQLYYVTSPQTYSQHMKYGYTDSFMDEEWQTAPLAYDDVTGRITGELPADADSYYIEVTAAVGGETVNVTSVFVENVR